MDAAGYEESFQEAQEAYRVAVEADVERLDKAADQALRQDDVSAEARTPQWQCRGRGGCGFRRNSYLADTCKVCRRSWYQTDTPAAKVAEKKEVSRKKKKVQASLLCFLVWRVVRARRHKQRWREISGA